MAALQLQLQYQLQPELLQLQLVMQLEALPPPEQQLDRSTPPPPLDPEPTRSSPTSERAPAFHYHAELAERLVLYLGVFAKSAGRRGQHSWQRGFSSRLTI